jgi:gliding motility-associated-like protein
LIFYISPIDGSIDTIQDNAGDDWVATGFESSTSTLFGYSVSQSLASVNVESGAETTIFFGYDEQIFAGEFDNVQGIFYGVGALWNPNGGLADQQLFKINTTTGALTTVGNLNLETTFSWYYLTDVGINGLAYDPVEDVLYGIAFNGNLYRINLNDASTTLVGNGPTDCRGLAYDAGTQKLWAIKNDATLIEIDKNTGAQLSTVPCQVPFNFITSLTYAPEPFEIQEFTCTDTVHVVLSSDAFLSLGNDTLLCNTPQFTLSQPGFSNYLWQDGTEDDQFIASASGEYILQASNSAGCIDTDTLSIQFVNFSVTATASPTNILVGDTVQLNASGAFSYLWTPEEGVSCSNCASPSATPSESTTYIVSAIDSFGCRSADTIRIEVDIICKEPFIPTIFSPNGKGPQANETFCVFSDCVEQFKLVIHNRWGEQVFITEDITQCWNGTFKGSEAAIGVYAYNVYLKQLDGTVINKFGNISLMR